LAESTPVLTSPFWGKIFVFLVLTGLREDNNLGAMKSHPSPFSIPAGTGKSAPPIGAGLALIVGIFIACTLTARGEAILPEEPLPSSTDYTTASSTDYTVAQTNAAPPAPSLPYPVAAYGSKDGVPAGEGVPSAEPRRFHYILQLTARGVYDDNINISHTDRKSDYYFAIEPRITLGFGDIEGRGGDYIRLDYMPSFLIFVDHSDNDAVDHLIRLEARHQFSRLTLYFSQDVDILNNANLNSFIDTTGQNANIDVSTNTRLNLYVSRLRAYYDLTAKTFLSGEFDASIYDYSNDFINSEIFSGGLYFNYRWTPKVTVGIGGTFGFDNVDDPNPDQTFEQVNVRLSYEATGKLNFYGSVGAEFRQFDGNRSERTTPVFEIGAIYHPFDSTTITLSANRNMFPSGFFPDQDFAATNVVLRIQQRLLQRVYLGLSAGYENADYFATDSGVSATRNDDYYFVEPSVDVLITRFLSAGVYYLHRRDDSSIAFFSFYDNQVGVRATIRF
jgi:hypothetical protein